MLPPFPCRWRSWSDDVLASESDSGDDRRSNHRRGRESILLSALLLAGNRSSHLADISETLALISVAFLSATNATNGLWREVRLLNARYAVHIGDEG
jgi:hypothetical protein